MKRRSWTAVVAVIAVLSLTWGSHSAMAAVPQPFAAERSVAAAAPHDAAALASGSAEVVDTGQWMKELEAAAPTALDVPLWQFIFPGSHDAGTYGLEAVAACGGCDSKFNAAYDYCLYVANPTVCGTATDFARYVSLPWAQTQDQDLEGQLNDGSRFFDLRFFRAIHDDAVRTATNSSAFVLKEGEFYIHHSLSGPTVEEIFDSVVAFLTADGHERELIILRLDKLYEGNGSMGEESLNDLFRYIDSRIGDYLTPAALGDDASPKELLDAGHQVILATSEVRPTDPDLAANVWTIPNYWITDDEGGYPRPDESEAPWRSASEIVSTASQAFRQRADANALSSTGLSIGLDDDGVAMFRGLLCPQDLASLWPGPDGGQLCSALDNDYDEFQSLEDVSTYTNSRLLPSLTQIPRKFVNIVHVDYYPKALTQEVYTLNRGATRTAVRIVSVDELTSHDTGLEFDTAEPDFYPVFTFPDVPSADWETRDERNQRRPDEGLIFPSWPGWRAYPNDWGDASVTFGIRDADLFSDDDDSAIDGSATTETISIDVSGCVQDVFRCPQNLHPGLTQISGTGDADSSSVTYSVYACVWSFLPGQPPDPRSVCDLSETARPRVSILDAESAQPDVAKSEGSATTPTTFAFEVRLDRPVARETSIRYQLLDDTAQGTQLLPCTDPCDYIGSDGYIGYVTIPAGLTSARIEVDVTGDDRVEADEAFEVRIFDGWPAEQTLNMVDASATGRILNDDEYSVNIDSANAKEGSFLAGGFTQCIDSATPLNFTVSLNEVRAETVTVDWSTADGTARAGSDYDAANGTLTFSPGELSKPISVVVKCDVTFEPNETLEVVLSNARNAVIVAGGGIGTIENDDDGTSIAISKEANLQEGDSGTRDLVFEIGTSTFDHQPVTVFYETVDGTAHAPDDYTAVSSGSVTFQTGDTRMPISVSVNGDTAFEPDETFFVRIVGFDAGGADGFAIDPNQDEGSATITNDDGGTLTVGDISIMEGTGCTTTPASFTLDLSKAGATPVTVRYDTSSGSAKADSDYRPASGLVTFAPGARSQTVTVDVTCDSTREADEYFVLILSVPTGASLGAHSTGVAWIRNDDRPPAPVVTPVVSGTLGDDGWYVSDVSVHFDVATFDAAATESAGCVDATITADTGGSTFTCTVTTDGGTASETVTVRRDTTDPTAIGVLSGPTGDDGWRTGATTVVWTLDDELSGVVSTCPDETSAAEGIELSFECTVSDAAGNEASFASPTYQLDSTDPAVTFVGNTGVYSVTDTVAITCTAADSLSGIASDTCLDLRGPAYSFPLGPQTYTASATDNAGNVGSGSTGFTVTASPKDLCILAKRWVASSSIASSLCSKLDTADRAFLRDSVTSGNAALSSFINQVNALTPKQLDATHARVLVDLAAALKQRAPSALLSGAATVP